MLEFLRFKGLTTEIFWFFFDYFLLGSVEDLATGQCLRHPEDSPISIYVEVREFGVHVP